MISCEHVIAQRVVLLFFPVNCNKLYPTSLTKIVQITCAIYQGLSKRRLFKEYVRRSQRLIYAEFLPLLVLFPSSQRNNVI